MSFFLMIVNIALKIKKPFYKLIALGLGTEYAFQVFLTIGGITKFIPMTGVTFLWSAMEEVLSRVQY